MRQIMSNPIVAVTDLVLLKDLQLRASRTLRKRQEISFETNFS